MMRPHASSRKIAMPRARMRAARTPHGIGRRAGQRNPWFKTTGSPINYNVEEWDAEGLRK
jgi:hypothetical protein